jgi:phosphonate transport system substrate-binding protein
MPRPLALLVLLAAAALPGGVAAAPGTAELVFGVVPQQSPSALAKGWIPILDYLGERAGVRLRFATASQIPVFEKRVAAGEYDVAYMNPYHYTVFHREPGYEAVAKEQDRRLRGILVVRKDGPIQSIEQLADERVAFPGPAAFAATLLPQGQLARLGLAIRPEYVSSHDSVYLSVARGLYPAGGGIPRTLENMDLQTRDQLRILWTTSDFTPHAIAVHPRVPAAVRARLVAAMLAMADDAQGAALLERIGFHGLVAARNADYDDIRDLALKALERTSASGRPASSP